MSKNITRMICFLLVLGLILVGINNIFKFKYSDGIYALTKYYELEDDTVDVLVLGSSHAFEDVNTGTLWDEYGIASYVLAGAAQPMWNTYYYLKEALKTQTPKLIVLEGFGVKYDFEYGGDSKVIKNTYGLKWSPDKIEAIKVSAPEDRWKDYFLGYMHYHSRYGEISAEDFLPNLNDQKFDDWKGFGCNMDTTPIEARDVTEIKEEVPLYEKSEKYYRMIIELAQEKNIPIVITINPYAGIARETQKKFNTAEKIAKEYGAPFQNYNLKIQDIGLDFLEDAADDGHLNYKGNQKFTTYLGAYLKDNYEIPDRRNDEAYSSWQRNADYIRQMILEQQSKQPVDDEIYQSEPQSVLPESQSEPESQS